MNIAFHSFIYAQNDKVGHLFHYQLSLRHSVRVLGFQYRGYLNKSCTLSDYPKDWEKSLTWVVTNSKLSKFRNLIHGILGFSRFFLGKNPKKMRRILFVESLNAIDMLTLALSACFFAHKFDHVWLMFHVDYRNQPLLQWVQKVCIRVLDWRLRKRVQLFTLSDLTKVYYEHKLSMHVNLLPYPYPAPTPPYSNDKKMKNFVWWPGSPRADKGLDTILLIAKHFEKGPLQLALSEESSPLLKNHPQLVFMKAEQEREEYISLLTEARGVLLPYDSEKYRRRSSGIFIESIILGKPVFVRSGTWLASELLKYDLEELVLEWEHPDVVQKIERLMDDIQVDVKLKKMQQSYLEYHSLETQTRCIREILIAMQ